jgi:transposase InsO family protein
MESKKLAEINGKEVFQLQRLPKTIVSDRGLLFSSEFWKHLCERLGIKQRLSTAFHLQTDAKTESITAVRNNIS